MVSVGYEQLEEQITRIRSPEQQQRRADQAKIDADIAASLPEDVEDLTLEHIHLAKRGGRRGAGLFNRARRSAFAERGEIPLEDEFSAGEAMASPVQYLIGREQEFFISPEMASKYLQQEHELTPAGHPLRPPLDPELKRELQQIVRTGRPSQTAEEVVRNLAVVGDATEMGTMVPLGDATRIAGGAGMGVVGTLQDDPKLVQAGIGLGTEGGIGMGLVGGLATAGVAKKLAPSVRQAYIARTRGPVAAATEIVRRYEAGKIPASPLVYRSYRTMQDAGEELSEQGQTMMVSHTPRVRGEDYHGPYSNPYPQQSMEGLEESASGALPVADSLLLRADISDLADELFTSRKKMQAIAMSFDANKHRLKRVSDRIAKRNREGIPVDPKDYDDYAALADRVDDLNQQNMIARKEHELIRGKEKALAARMRPQHDAEQAVKTIRRLGRSDRGVGAAPARLTQEQMEAGAPKSIMDTRYVVNTIPEAQILDSPHVRYRIKDFNMDNRWPVVKAPLYLEYALDNNIITDPIYRRIATNIKDHRLLSDVHVSHGTATGNTAGRYYDPFSYSDPTGTAKKLGGYIVLDTGKKGAVRVLIHETAHAVTLRSLMLDRRLVAQIERLRVTTLQNIRKDFIENAGGIPGVRGLENKIDDIGLAYGPIKAAEDAGDFAARDELLISSYGYNHLGESIWKISQKEKPGSLPQTADEYLIEKLGGSYPRAVPLAVGDEARTINYIKWQYGLSSPDEFLAEIASNPKFRDTLKSIKIGNRNIMDYIKDMYASVLGLAKQDADALFYGMDALERSMRAGKHAEAPTVPLNTTISPFTGDL